MLGALGSSPLRRALAIAASAALLVQGAAWALEPVHCSMTGAVSSGRCPCDPGGGEASLLPDCCQRVAATAPTTTSTRPAAVDAAPPAGTALLPLPPPALPARPAWQREARVGGPSPPLALLHRALLR